jgi:hypothetical protein
LRALRRLQREQEPKIALRVHVRARCYIYDRRLRPNDRARPYGLHPGTLSGA